MSNDERVQGFYDHLVEVGVDDYYLTIADGLLSVCKDALRALNTAPKFAVHETNSYAIAKKLEGVLAQAEGN